MVFAGSCAAQIVAPDGAVSRRWSDEGCHRWEHAELLSGGDLVAVGARLDEDVVPDPIETGRYLLRMSPSGSVIWRKDMNAHHDLSVAPDGSFLTLVMTRRHIPEIDPVNDVADEMLTRLTPNGEVLESISLYDVLAASHPPFPLQRAGAHDVGKSKLIDLFHCNAIRPAPAYGPHAVIVTSRHQDALMVIDLAARRLLWHWGRGVLSGPHEGTLLADGNVLVFDNGLTRGWSRVLEVDPRAPANTRQFAPGEAKFFDRVMGSCQRLANGNTLIVHSEGGSAVELAPEGMPVWTYEGTEMTPDGHRTKIIRMRRLGPAS